MDKDKYEIEFLLGLFVLMFITFVIFYFGVPFVSQTFPSSESNTLSAQSISIGQ